MDSSGEDTDVKPADGVHPDIHQLFCHYNALYFRDSLGACAVSWASSSSSSYTGHCQYYNGGCEIRLSEPLLKIHSASDLKNVLLHEMIHAFLWIENNNRDHSDHGLGFQAMMNSINSSSVMDPQRPTGGYNITIDHESQKDHDNNRVRQWICELCGKVIMSTMNRGPSASDCIGNLGSDECCDNLSCHWHNHKKFCSGSYVLQGPSECNDIKTSLKGEQECDEDRTERLPHLAGSTKQRLHRAEQKKDKFSGKKDSVAKYFLSSGDAARSSLNNSSSRDDSWMEVSFEQLKNTESQSQTLHTKVHKRGRTSISKKHACLRSKRRKLGNKCGNEYTVVIGWLGLFEDEESDDDSEPLVNKRSERRRKQKLLDDRKDGNTQSEVINDATPSHRGCSKNDGDRHASNVLLDCTDGCKSACGSISEPMTGGRKTPPKQSNDHQIASLEMHAKDFHIVQNPSTVDGLPSQLADNGLNLKDILSGCRCVKIQDGSCEGISPSNPPDIVDISDG